MPSAFEELCESKGLQPEAWRDELARPIIASKNLLDMSDAELEEHYERVEERAEATREDRALIVLERTLEGRLERRAVKVFQQNAAESGKACADQIPDLLESLGFEVSNTEVHYLLRKFNATEDFDMIPEAELDRKQWLWLVGECQMLKNSYEFVNPQAFELCYEALVQNLKQQREASLEGTDQWPHITPTGPGWGMFAGVQPGYKGPLKPYVWGMQPDVEQELVKQMIEEDEARGTAEAPGTAEALSA